MNDRKPPLFDFVERDPQHDDVFHVCHPECTGRFRLHKPSFGREMDLERLKSRLIGSPNPTANAEMFAEWAATVSTGIAEGPTAGDEPELSLDDVVDSKLIQALYGEVVAYWATFRS